MRLAVGRCYFGMSLFSTLFGALRRVFAVLLFLKCRAFRRRQVFRQRQTTSETFEQVRSNRRSRTQLLLTNGVRNRWVLTGRVPSAVEQER